MYSLFDSSGHAPGCIFSTLEEFRRSVIHVDHVCLRDHDVLLLYCHADDLQVTLDRAHAYIYIEARQCPRGVTGRYLVSMYCRILHLQCL